MRRPDTCSGTWFRSQRWLAALLCVAASCAVAEPLPRHPLEVRALVEPDAVITELPPLIEAAQKRGDLHELALLQLARANACRVIADWNCQRDAGNSAHDASVASGDTVLAVRGLLASARGSIALQDFSRGEQLLGEAQRLLQIQPLAELEADVFLAYSSLSYSLGKHSLSIEYAERGLVLVGGDREIGTRVRLLRNRARAEAELGNPGAAQRSLAQALPLLGDLADPKLRAELLLETARVAHSKNDVETQRSSGDEMLRLAQQLNNAQIAGQAHEVLGLAAGMTDTDTAARELRLALIAFRRLNQGREELRVLRELIPVEIHRHAPRGGLELLVLREVQLSRSIDEADRAKSSADFDARVKYAQNEIELARVRQEALLATERAAALVHTGRLTVALIVLAGVMLLVLATFFLLQWRAKRRLQRAYERYRDSEGRYRMLADNSRDVVVRMCPDGRRLYVSPAGHEMLGWTTEELSEPRWELVHPDDRAQLRHAIASLVARGGTARACYRARHRDGHYVWIEALAQLVPAADGRGTEIVYSGRDVTTRVQAEEALAESQRRLLAVTDNIPALIAQFDRDARYRFANDYHRKVLRLDPAKIIGRGLGETGGDAVYTMAQPYIEAALRGETVQFEGEIEVGGQHYQFQSHYVPDRADDGSVRGFFSLTFDITALKQAQQELARLARHDSLSGVANRRHFDERLNLALTRSQRSGRTLALFYLDIDHFKHINDSLGHGVGDEVIVEFARRLVRHVRGEDLVARLGGDEFAILVEEVESAAAAEVIAAKLVAAMHAEVPTSAGQLSVTTSVGAAYGAGTIDAIGLTALADQALYAAKSAGRNSYRLRTTGFPP